MNKLLLLGVVGALTLTGCTATPTAPQATVTVTAEAQPTKAATSAPKQTQSSSSVEEEFIMYMMIAGTPDWLLEGEALDILVDQAQTVCGYIADGDSKEDIVWMLTIASEASDASPTITDAFLAATVAATYTYCPQYEGFWD